jgi:hypothetical protein
LRKRARCSGGGRKGWGRRRQTSKDESGGGRPRPAPRTPTPPFPMPSLSPSIRPPSASLTPDSKCALFGPADDDSLQSSDPPRQCHRLQWSPSLQMMTFRLFLFSSQFSPLTQCSLTALCEPSWKGFDTQEDSHCTHPQPKLGRAVAEPWEQAEKCPESHLWSELPKTCLKRSVFSGNLQQFRKKRFNNIEAREEKKFIFKWLKYFEHINSGALLHSAEKLVDWILFHFSSTPKNGWNCDSDDF